MVRIAQALAKLGWEKAVAVAILALALLFPTQIKPFIDTFAFGTSLGKIYAFAVYVLLLAFLRLPFKLEGKHVLLALAVLFAFGLFGQIYYQSQSGTDYGSKTFMFDSRGYTSTHINHIHVSKTSLCLISPSDDFDCARPAIPYLPPFYPQIGMLLLLIAVAACLSYYPSLSSPDKVAYAILSFASLKCALDGGFFNFESIAFFMLIPFLLANEKVCGQTFPALESKFQYNKKKLAFTLAGALAWVPFTLFAYQFYDPITLALPFLAFFYPVAIFAHNPKLFFPLLLIAFFAPSAITTDSRIVTDRWQADACAGAGASPDFQATIYGTIYSNCTSSAQFACGNLTSNGQKFIYSGQSLKTPEMLLSRGFSQACGHGVFSIDGSQSAVKIISRANGWQTPTVLNSSSPSPTP